jgi:hypothetical protein
MYRVRPVAALVAAAIAAGLSGPAVASSQAQFSPMTVPAGQLVYGTSPNLPPQGYSGRWWTSPNKCDYSRAGRPGEIVWYLIINTAHRGCEPYMVQQGFADAYGG